MTCYQYDKLRSDSDFGVDTVAVRHTRWKNMFMSLGLQADVIDWY